MYPGKFKIQLWLRVEDEGCIWIAYFLLIYGGGGGGGGKAQKKDVFL